MIKCMKVLIKFMDKNVPAQEIRSLAITGADHLQVNEGFSFITLDCCTKDGHLVEQINFKKSEVKEYVCQSIVWGPTLPSSFSNSPGVCNQNITANTGAK